MGAPATNIMAALGADLPAPQPPTHRELMQQAVMTNEEALVRIARVNRDVFNAYVLEDETGKQLSSPAPIHREWSKHIEHCIRVKKFAGIIAPFGHGKTEQTVIGATLFDLARNPQLRIKIVSNTDVNAMARVKAISKYIEENERFHRVFPNIEPDYDSGWNEHQIFIKRDGYAKDPSIQAFGILGSGTGGRADKLVFDDPVDMKNAILEPQSRERVIHAIKGTWMSRLDETKEEINYCPVIYVATIWHELDATCQYVMKNPQFSVLYMPINQENTAIDCTRDGAEKFTIALWNDKWDKPALDKRESTLGPRNYARGFRLRAFSDDDIALGSFPKCLRYDLTIAEALKSCGSNWKYFTGIDPAGDKRSGFAMFTLAYSPSSHVKIPVDIRVGAWRGRAAIEQAKEVNRLFHPEYFSVENNATQVIFEEWLREAGGGDMRVRGVNTGGEKSDLNIGVPGLDIEFSNALWVVALHDHDHRGEAYQGHDCPWCRWIKETQFYPIFGSTDILMASWFAASACRGGGSLDEIIAGIKSIGKPTLQTPGDIPDEMKPARMRVASGRATSTMDSMRGW